MKRKEGVRQRLVRTEEGEGGGRGGGISPTVPGICDKGACDLLYSNQSLCIPRQFRAGSSSASASLVRGRRSVCHTRLYATPGLAYTFLRRYLSSCSEFFLAFISLNKNAQTAQLCSPAQILVMLIVRRCRASESLG